MCIIVLLSDIEICFDNIEVEILRTRVIIYFSPHCMATETPLFSGGFCFAKKQLADNSFV
ncbi:MAG: hypothetical protein COX80_02905 [Candidatus Magasanikbacteria bacterium CG_4_10_14_0_2_um_filter_33_14]|uniref:Uncharacterized protein n=1 Tax=Candidatus Magasanikbacteria bacterium CG_4_10_14_0_2_um_filter_33_14 TaxID=1974636 RepID=A0A2M7VAP3_9BACT|nr:MAG: hypothetical protein COX80_02905 [Candidatus Magasanikbacteria bacterium CG_4_10_14_0_2_um_filter_33_14]